MVSEVQKTKSQTYMVICLISALCLGTSPIKNPNSATVRLFKENLILNISPIIKTRVCFCGPLIIQANTANKM